MWRLWQSLEHETRSSNRLLLEWLVGCWLKGHGVAGNTILVDSFPRQLGNSDLKKKNQNIHVHPLSWQKNTMWCSNARQSLGRRNLASWCLCCYPLCLTKLQDYRIWVSAGGAVAVDKPRSQQIWRDTWDVLKERVILERKNFPMLRIGSVTIQGVRALYNVCMDGLQR